jgi:hypothetical protein
MILVRPSFVARLLLGFLPYFLPFSVYQLCSQFSLRLLALLFAFQLAAYPTFQLSLHLLYFIYIYYPIVQTLHCQLLNYRKWKFWVYLRIFVVFQPAFPQLGHQRAVCFTSV